MHILIFPILNDVGGLVGSARIKAHWPPATIGALEFIDESRSRLESDEPRSTNSDPRPREPSPRPANLEFRQRRHLNLHPTRTHLHVDPLSLSTTLPRTPPTTHEIDPVLLSLLLLVDSVDFFFFWLIRRVLAWLSTFFGDCWMDRKACMRRGNCECCLL